MEIEMTYVTAMKHFFGFKEGQTVASFAMELKALSMADKIYFKEGLEKSGYKITNL